MTLAELAMLNGQATPEAIEGAKIPWDNPEFSKRMLENHLAQEHDWASRRKDIISRHVEWIHSCLPSGSHILDLGCGPGLYTHMLAEKGHHCTGVDFSPASIAYAREQALKFALKIEYVQEDIRKYTANRQFECIIMTFGEFNVFSRQDSKNLLESVASMLVPGGMFLLEAHNYAAVQEAGEAPASWERNTSGLFSPHPHLLLQENTWNAVTGLAVTRYFLIDAASSQVTPYASAMQAYTGNEYENMLLNAGLPVTDTLNNDAWPAGKIFEGKLQVYICHKN